MHRTCTWESVQIIIMSFKAINSLYMYFTKTESTQDWETKHREYIKINVSSTVVEFELMPFDLCDVAAIPGGKRLQKRLQKGCRKPAKRPQKLKKADVIRHLDVTEMHGSIVHKAIFCLNLHLEVWFILMRHNVTSTSNTNNPPLI